VALLAYLAFSGPHLVFHLGHLPAPGGPGAAALVAVLAGSVVLPLALLVAALRRRPEPVDATRERAPVPS
jgi:hypothetical protein